MLALKSEGWNLPRISWESVPPEGGSSALPGATDDDNRGMVNAWHRPMINQFSETL
jgi:hypothetical protein